MADTASSGNGGIGLCTALFITFLVLKLCGVIGWSWWWVTAPLWIPAGVVVALLIVILLVCLVVAVASVICD